MNPANGRVLRVHTGSLADLVQVLPSVSDLHRLRPGLAIDWLVDSRLVEIARLHPAVKRVIGVPGQPWRQALLDRSARHALGQARAALGALPCDLVFDLQGRVASVLWGVQVSGLLVGYARHQIAEPLAGLAYRRSTEVSPEVPTLTRHRRLVAAQLGLPMPDTPADFGIIAPPLPWRAPVLSAALLPGPDLGQACWPDAHWIALGQRLSQARLQPVVLAAEPADQARAARMAEACGGLAPDTTGLGAVAAVLTQVRRVVAWGPDLPVLAAALGRPTLGIACPPLAGLAGGGRAGLVTLGLPGQPPRLDEAIAALGSMLRR